GLGVATTQVYPAVRFSTTQAGPQRRDVSSEGMPYRSSRLPGAIPHPVGAGSRRGWPREGDVPTVKACLGCAESDWDVSTASACSCTRWPPPLCCGFNTATTKRGCSSMALDVLNRRSFGETMRRDAWWVQPLVVFLGLGTFIVYSTWAAFQGNHYRFGHYLSPF